MSPRQKISRPASLFRSLALGEGGVGRAVAEEAKVRKGSREMWQRVLERGKESSQRSQRGMGESTGNKRGK